MSKKINTFDKMVIKKEIIYPVFLECMKYSNDDFWKHIFEDLAYGKAPYGCYIAKDFLCCGFKGKEFNYKIKTIDEIPNFGEMFNEVYFLLNNKLGILSIIDRANKLQDFNKFEENIKLSRADWHSIKKKNAKDFIIENYVIKIKNKYKLSLKQSRYLLSLIIIGIMFKTIASSDIDYDDGQIKGVNGIVVINGSVATTKDFLRPDYTEPIINIESKRYLVDMWKKHTEKKLT